MPPSIMCLAFLEENLEAVEVFRESVLDCMKNGLFYDLPDQRGAI